MKTDSKKVMTYMAIAIIALLITFVSTASMLIYSFSDHGVIVSKPVELENVSINLLQNITDNTIKLECVNVHEQSVENYLLILMNDRRKVLSEIEVTIDSSLIEQPIYQANCDLTDVYFWKLTKD